MGDHVGAEWTLFGTAVEILIDAFTEPDVLRPQPPGRS
ncbi:hypothetical protein BH20ACT4_BH20ACT4_14560 [soil metagenome]